MPAFDNHAAIQSTIDEITMGLVTEETSFAREFCRVKDDVVALSGIITGLNSEATLARTDNARLLPGEEANDQGGGSEVTTYLCLPSQGYAYIAKSDLQQIGGASGVNTLETHVKTCVSKANAGVDWWFAQKLADTNLNRTFDTTANLGSGIATGEWDDTANSNPLGDILYMHDILVPQANSIVYGPAARRIMVSHPNFSSEFTNWSGGGVLDKGALPAFLSAKTGIPVENIFELRVSINEATQGRGVTHGFVFNEGFWMGKRENCILVDPQAPQGGMEINHVTSVDTVIRKRGVELSHEVYHDTIRANLDSGCYVQNVKTAA